MANLNDISSRAWLAHNIIAFMVEGVPDDSNEKLPVRCTLIELRTMVYDLAVAISNLGDEVRNG
jgi:hypothetical protein